MAWYNLNQELEVMGQSKLADDCYLESLMNNEFNENIVRIIWRI